MAEFDELDELLSGSLKRAAQPGDSAGVADTIRARVASGDVGTPAPSQRFGSRIRRRARRAGSPGSALIVVLGLVGGMLGVSPARSGIRCCRSPSANQRILIVAADRRRAGACPGGPVIAELPRGSQVLALARSADGAAVQVRNPADTRSDGLDRRRHAQVRLGQPAFATLPVGDACPAVTVHRRRPRWSRRR